MEWSPDGEKILTATTAPRLRIGNGFKVWHYSGALLHEAPWPTGQELLQVIWQKYDDNVFTEKPISNVKVQGIEPSQPQSSKAVYVPPNIRSGSIPSVMGSSPKSNYQPERGPIPGLPVGYKVSQGQRKKERNIKRKENEPAAKQGPNTNSKTSEDGSGDGGDSGGGGVGGNKGGKAQNTPALTQSNNKRNQQRTPKPTNNQNHTTGNGTSANNQSIGDSASKNSSNADSNSSANEQSNADAAEAKRSSRHRNRPRKSESGQGTSADAEKDKRIRAVQQKLKDITKLKVRRDNGENLEVNQLAKIKSEAELVKELSALKMES